MPDEEKIALCRMTIARQKRRNFENQKTPSAVAIK